MKTLWEKEKMLVTSIFSFSHNVFKRVFTQGSQKSGLCGKELTFTLEILILTHQHWTAFENIVGKGEFARNEHFLLFAHCSIRYLYPHFGHIFDNHTFIATELEDPKVGI